MIKFNDPIWKFNSKYCLFGNWVKSQKSKTGSFVSPICCYSLCADSVWNNFCLGAWRCEEPEEDIRPVMHEGKQVTWYDADMGNFARYAGSKIGEEYD